MKTFLIQELRHIGSVFNPRNYRVVAAVIGELWPFCGTTVAPFVALLIHEGDHNFLHSRGLRKICEVEASMPCKSVCKVLVLSLKETVDKAVHEIYHN